MNGKTLCLAVAMCIVILLITACESGNITGKAVSEQKKEIRIGAPLSLTGKLASVGEDMKNAIEIGIEDVNSQNKNYKFSVIYDDTTSDTNPAVTVVTKMLEVDNIHLLIGPVSSGSVLAAAPLTEKKKTIMFSISSAEQISQAGDYVFRNRETGNQHGPAISRFLSANNISRIAVIATNSPNSQTYARAIRENFGKVGGKEVYEAEYAPETTDFRTIILKAKNMGAEALYLAGASGADSAIIAKQAREMKFSGLITGSSVLGLPEFINGAGDAAEGIIFTYPYVNKSNPTTKNFIEKYSTRYSKEPSNFATSAYDTVYFIADAVDYCKGDQNTDCIRDYLYSIKDYDGADGKTSFDKNGDALKIIGLKIIINREVVDFAGR